MVAMEKEFLLASAADATARVVFEAPGVRIPTPAANKSEVGALIAGLKKAPQVASVSEPFTSGPVRREERSPTPRPHRRP